MNFLTMKQELADRLSAFDETVSADDTRLGRWINMAQNELIGEWDWDFTKSLDVIQTVTDYTTGTASVSAGDTAVTLSVAPTVSLLGRFIQFEGSDDWYEITAHTASTTAVTISPSYGQTVALSSGTFTVRKVYYTLDSVIDSILGVKIGASALPYNMTSLASTPADMVLNIYSTVSKPMYYFLTVPTSAGLPQIAFYPVADAAYNVYVVSKKHASDLSNSTDETIIPVPYQTVLLDLASYYGFTKLNNSGMATNAYQKYQAGVAKMKAIYSQNKGHMRIMRAVDGEMSPELTFVWPSNFGPYVSGT